MNQNLLKRTSKLQARISVRTFSQDPKQAPKIDSCLYKTLDVSKDANQIEIREAFLQKAREFHPDRRPECLEYFTHCTKAYEILSDNQKRAVYDDEQISDKDFFSVQIGPYKVNLIGVMLSTALVGVGYFGYIKLNQINNEGACPLNHKTRNEMI